MASSKITKALARRISQAKGKPVGALVFAAIDSEKLTLSSFAERAKQRNAAVKDQMGRVMERVQAWEKSSGTSVPVAFKPDQAAVEVTGPVELLEALAEDEAVAALDVTA
ncbi:MAG TPA: hypothetical protein VFX49_07500 [Chloroflexota bacterium]|nr:hypothetical protein [Chloroflexota bacterium]